MHTAWLSGVYSTFILKSLAEWYGNLKGFLDRRPVVRLETFRQSNSLSNMSTNSMVLSSSGLFIIPNAVPTELLKTYANYEYSNITEYAVS